MERRVKEGDGFRRHGSGGIISLAKIIGEHRGAIEYDLITMTGYQLRDIGKSLSWSAVNSFLQNERADSALMQELHPEFAGWGSTFKTNTILADIFDMLANINSNLVALGSGKAAKQPKPYPRPVKKKPEDERHFGRGALPPDELRKWFEEKRKHAGSSKRDSGSDSGTGRGTAVTN